MSAYVKVLLAGLSLATFTATVQASESASGSGMRYYQTGRPVPAQFLADNNVIQNYHHCHLDKPADGYEWVHGVENDYLLVSSKSGILRRIEYRLNIPRDPSESK